MALQFSVTLRNNQLDQVESTTGTSAKLQIRTGAPPANTAAADSGWYEEPKKTRRRRVIIDGLTYFVTPAEEIDLINRLIESLERKLEPKTQSKKQKKETTKQSYATEPVLEKSLSENKPDLAFKEADDSIIKTLNQQDRIAANLRQQEEIIQRVALSKKILEERLALNDSEAIALILALA